MQESEDMQVKRAVKEQKSAESENKRRLTRPVTSGELTAAQAEEISAAKRSGRGNRDGQDQGTTQNANPSSTGSAIYSI